MGKPIVYAVRTGACYVTGRYRTLCKVEVPMVFTVLVRLLALVASSVLSLLLRPQPTALPP
jgi:hypothetical protein